MSNIEMKRFGRPIEFDSRRKKILEYVADIYSKNFNGKTIPLDKLNVIEKLPNFESKTLTYYIESETNNFDYHDIFVVVEVTRHFDVISCKMYENVVNPSNICKSFAKSFESYDGGDW